MQERSHSELVGLRKLAHEIASRRRERLTSVHLLAAIAEAPSAASELLRERRLDTEALLKASRAYDDEGPDPIVRLLAGAREARAHGALSRPAQPGPEASPSAVHLLLSILADRQCAAHRALAGSGVDLGRLRARAMQLAMGFVSTRATAPRAVEPPPRSRSVPPPVPTLPAPSARPELGPARARPRPGEGPGVVVPLFPPPGLRAPSVGRRAPVPAEEPPAWADERPAAPADEPTPPTPEREPPVLSPTAEASPPPLAPGGARIELFPNRHPLLASLGEVLTLSARDQRLAPVVGRERELEQALRALGRRSASSALFVGAPGVGKSALLRGVAQALFDAEQASGDLTWMVEISPAELLAESGTRAAVVERLQAVRREARELRGRVVLAVDDAHELFALEEAALELRLAMTRGELRVVATTTPEEWKKLFEPSVALARCFTTISVEEPDEEAACELLAALAPELEQHHRVRYQEKALADAVGWSVRYLPGRALPDKAIAVLDLAGARVRREAGAAEPSEVRSDDVAEVVSELADLPVERLLETDGERMLRLEDELATRVVGHREALSTVARILRRNAAGIRGARPIGSFLLLGPTGVGKTETAKALAEAMFHSPHAMTRIDLSEYAEPHSLARLVGAPPGYVGFEAGGQLTEAVRKRPYQVLLLDEIEKAHRDVLMAFLQVLDEGHLTDARGRRVDFTSTVVLLTSNLGVREAHAARTARAVGFTAAERPTSTDTRGKGAQLEAAKAWLAPELYNRIDEVIVFAPLGPSDVEEVARRMLARLAASLDERGVALTVADDVPAALLASGGFEPELGARPMRRAIARLVEAPLAELLLRKDVGPGDEVAVEVHEGALCLVPRRRPPARRSIVEQRAAVERADRPTARGV